MRSSEKQRTRSSLSHRHDDLQLYVGEVRDGDVLTGCCTCFLCRGMPLSPAVSSEANR